MEARKLTRDEETFTLVSLEKLVAALLALFGSLAREKKREIVCIHGISLNTLTMKFCPSISLLCYANLMLQ